MNNKILIAPSILSADFSKMGEEVLNLKKAGADIIHADVMDGVFVPNITFGIKMVEDIRKITDMPIDSHLMIVNPEKYVEKFAKAGSTYITVHYEACGENLGEVLDLIKSYGVKAGAVINPDTPVEKIEKIVEKCDMILLMSVFPGFGGQKFIESVLPKIKQTKELIEKSGKEILLEIDGGITEENVQSVIDLGANVIVAGSTVFKAKDKAQTINNLRGK